MHILFDHAPLQTAEAYFFDQTSFHHAELDFFDHSYSSPNPVATGLRTIQFLF
jgi:hypothetical protein